MSARKDIRQLVRRLRSQGWTAVQAKSGHWRLTNPAGRSMTCSVTPKGNRALTAARLDARRLGADV